MVSAVWATRITDRNHDARIRRPEAARARHGPIRGIPETRLHMHMKSAALPKSQPPRLNADQRIRPAAKLESPVRNAAIEQPRAVFRE